ncbi:NAD(P)/FAD-dependent oxidoreductase [Sinomicrobium weinanense]|uniref:NAD(P)/FAD-dependent oxidoreductase n=1 Tax=Sinomicrobium weinanense TaxID=2842200 RepID=A0A926JNC3_9FLAO|nr:NAD(P)/FAD-dependent oxidoreductase [Sinomicrobium weinanense]MBC9794371.1 NAD(P)/FAD-dependent oxidoreductase [Sinomicrobium weinanense]MBU3124278.1 NAD(P)/FAD-dependent oxidoreductase [Sinomicrobium weinanense]
MSRGKKVSSELSQKQKDADVVIVGGGAAGFFAAAHIAEAAPGLRIAILERGGEVLSKVKVSGGGRCNVTHAEFVPRELAGNYPRGQKELLGPFHSFCSGDTVEFFESRGVRLKIEEDGRMFPITDSSQTIIDCLVRETSGRGVEVYTGHAVKQVNKGKDGWELVTSKGNFNCCKLLIATGGSPKMWDIAGQLGHTIVPPVPSLFTFHIKDPRISGLMGISAMVTVRLSDGGGKMMFEGPLLITHWGMSGPAVLKLSAWAARELHRCNYRFKVEVNWLRTVSFSDALEILRGYNRKSGKKYVHASRPFDIPKRLWTRLAEASGIRESQRWAEISKNGLEQLAEQLTKGIFKVNGKSTFKEEFVTAGGVDLKEIDFKTFESKIHKNLFFAGEVLNIDAVTGGFNFQNAWTGGFLAARGIVEKSGS